MLGIMYLSFSNRTLNFIWHGFHFPNQIPYRESFIMSFLLVFIGFLTIRRIRALGAKYVTGAVLSSAVFLIFYEKFGSGNESYIQIGGSLLFLIIQGAALHTVSNTKAKKSEFFCETLLTVTMMIEMFAASLTTIGLVAAHEGFTSYAPYGRNHVEVSDYAAEVEGSEGHMNFERSELFPNNVCDLQSLYNVKGLSIFSSTARESFVKYMRNYGFHNNNINGLRNAGLTRVTATVLNVRNLIETDKTKSVPPLFEQEYQNGSVTAWGNPDAFSVGFMTDTAVIDYAPDYDNNLDVFDKTNQWIISMGGQSVYKPVILNSGFSTGISTQDAMGHVLVYTDQYSNAKGYEINLTVNNADIGSDVYIYANAKKGGTVTIVHGDEKRSFEIRSYQIICLGIFDGTPYEVTIKYQDTPGTSVFVYGYQLDQAGYQTMLDVLGDEQLEVTSYTDTSLSGHIEAKEDGLLFLSIPYSEGWTAEVDGREVEITPVQDALMGIKLEKGSHDITLKYSPRAVKEGVLISIVSIFLIALIALVPALIRKLRKNKKAEVAAASAVPAEGINAPEVSIEEVPVAAVMPEEPAEQKTEGVLAEAGGSEDEPVSEADVKPVAGEKKGSPETEDDQG